ncbi:MAG: response regulator [Candidatus Omnitrophica bacterium]|nr:response regulator [Candidatus Omnitrophota bacterium]
MRKILVVDDEPEIIELVEARLTANQFEVLSATDGKKGIAIAEQKKPDLILMDIMMPELSGGDAVKILKAKNETKDIPVIFLTGIYGKKMDGLESKGINVGGEYYPSIAKPFESDELISEIKALIG